MVYIKSLSLLAACVVGLFGKQVHQGSGCCKLQDGKNISVVHQVSTYLPGSTICEQSVVVGDQTKPRDLSNFVDRLNCRRTGNVVRYGKDKQGRESFYTCSDIKNSHSDSLVSNDVQKKLNRIMAQVDSTEKNYRVLSQYQEKNYPWIG